MGSKHNIITEFRYLPIKYYFWIDLFIMTCTISWGLKVWISHTEPLLQLLTSCSLLLWLICWLRQIKTYFSVLGEQTHEKLQHPLLIESLDNETSLLPWKWRKIKVYQGSSKMKVQGKILRYFVLKHTFYSRAQLIYYFQQKKPWFSEPQIGRIQCVDREKLAWYC